MEHAEQLVNETEAVTALALHRQIMPQGTLRVSLPPEVSFNTAAPLPIYWRCTDYGGWDGSATLSFAKCESARLSRNSLGST